MIDYLLHIYKKVSVLFLVMAAIAGCSKYPDDAFLEKIINARNLTGTVIIESPQENKKFVYNGKRARESYAPLSTFKILNTLIALQEGIIHDENDYIKWDGFHRGYEEWNTDQTIGSAFSSGCVWFYQQLARRIGREKYQYYLNTLKYGNGLVGNTIDTFWFDGTLRISAEEQMEFLKNIYYEKYPFSKNNYAILKKIMIIARSDKFVIRARIGWTMMPGQHLGWFVGYVETGSGTWFFVCNWDINKEEDALLGEKIIHKAFAEMGILR